MNCLFRFKYLDSAVFKEHIFSYIASLFNNYLLKQKIPGAGNNSLVDRTDFIANRPTPYSRR